MDSLEKNFSPSGLWGGLVSGAFVCHFPQNCMNLPPDKVQLLSQYDNEKKWELICDQVGTGKAHLPLPLFLGYPALRCRIRLGRGLSCYPGDNTYVGCWGPL